MPRGAANVIRDLWKRLNPEASKQRMAIAFAILAGGAVLSVLGVVVVALGDLVLPRPSWIRELGFVAAAGGLPVFLTGLAAALPSRWWERSLVAAGLLLTATGVGLFAWWYPDQWHLTVQAPNGYAIGSYLIGASFLAAGTAACLGTYLTERVHGAAQQGARGQQRDWSEEDIKRDIQWAREQGWNWGGIREDQVDVEIRLKEEIEPIQFKGRGKEYVETHEAGEHDVHAAHSLTNLRGIQPTRTDDDVDSQVGNLKKLREAKREQERAKRESWRWKLLHPIQWLGGN